MVRDGWNRGPKGGHMNLEAKCTKLAAMKWPDGMTCKVGSFPDHIVIRDAKTGESVIAWFDKPGDNAEFIKLAETPSLFQESA